MSATKKHWNKDNQTALVLATRALRAIASNKQALAATLVSKDPALTHTLASDTQVDLDKLKDFLNNNQDSHGAASALPPTTSPHNDTLQKHLTDKKLKHNYLKQLSNSLPNNKLRFHTLRKNDRSPPTNDPTEISNIASEFWAPHWSWETYDRHSSRQLLQGFDRKLTHDILTVDEELCKEVILQAGDTACGPDLIPFSVYKSLIDFTAPLLNDTYHAAASGAPPPKGANHSHLHLIPKCESDNICHSRPINVGNTDVRLLGAIVHKSIYDAVEKLISKRQKGFMKTRNILENIKLITEKIHQATTNKKDYDVLFIDFKKAFDSLNHNFLFSLLVHINMPTTTINVIKFLLTDLQALTTFRGSQPQSIKMEKGVKQGCPLSPLLFVLVMEVLDDAIIKPPSSKINQNNSDIDSALYADDACYGSPDLANHLPHLQTTLELFGKATGLNIHTTKSCIVKARRRAPLPELLPLSPQRSLCAVGKKSRFALAQNGSALSSVPTSPPKISSPTPSVNSQKEPTATSR